MLAYNLKPYQLSRPPWMDGMRFQIQAKVPPGATKDQLPVMIRHLLEERFRLKVHNEAKEMTILVLTVAKSGPKFRQAAEERVASDGKQAVPRLVGQSSDSNGRLRWRHERCSMEMLALMLGLTLRTPVTDATGLNGKYEIDLSWASEGHRPPGGEAEPGPTLFAALQEQLGLKLEQKRGPVDIVVVDRADKMPAEN